MNPRIPEPVWLALENYLLSTNQQLSGLLQGFYVVGSLALGGFDERFSDVDFVAVLTRRASPDDLEGLRAIHDAIRNGFPRWKFSGSYLQIHDLGRLGDDVAPHPYYHDGQLHPEGRFAINPVTWWILKNRSITLWGPEAQGLPFEADREVLLAWTRGNLNSYWAGWTRRVDRLFTLLSDWGVQWAVLGVLRQYYTLREASITTKVGAAEYALAALPARWEPIIREALRIREGEKKSAYRLRLVRMVETVRFLRHVIRTCNTEDAGS